jgi:pimeloyl-ACP methyl ester carboxylesterase
VENRLSELERDGSSLYFGTQGEGSPVLLTHGFAATSSMWAGQIEAFSDRRQLITWDMRGHGRSKGPSEPDGYSIDETLADMAALLDHHGHERAIIGGHSLGGYMSLAFCQKYPERVRGLLVIDTGPGYKSDGPREDWNEMAKGLGRRLSEKGLDTLARLSKDMNPSEHHSARELAMAAHGMLTQNDSSIIDGLSDIEAPTLVVVGEKDRSYLAASDYMAKKIPHAEQIIIPNAGHAVHVHQPVHFNQALESFFDRIDGTPEPAKDD